MLACWQIGTLGSAMAGGIHSGLATNARNSKSTEIERASLSGTRCYHELIAKSHLSDMSTHRPVEADDWKRKLMPHSEVLNCQMRSTAALRPIAVSTYSSYSKIAHRDADVRGRMNAFTGVAAMDYASCRSPSTGGSHGEKIY
jgi:hypothetical protein